MPKTYFQSTKETFLVVQLKNEILETILIAIKTQLNQIIKKITIVVKLLIIIHKKKLMDIMTQNRRQPQPKHQKLEVELQNKFNPSYFD